MVIVAPQLQEQLMLLLVLVLLLCIGNRPSCKGQSAIVVAALFAHLVLLRDVLPLAMVFVWALVLVLVLGSFHDHTCNRQCLFMLLLCCCCCCCWTSCCSCSGSISRLLTRFSVCLQRLCSLPFQQQQQEQRPYKALHVCL